MRALEVLEATGKSITHFRTGEKVKRSFEIVKIGLDLPRPVLYQRINNRVDNMVADGLLPEVQALLPYRQQNALQTVGYRELFRYFDDEVSLPQAVEDIKTSTRNYAKRQLTWFKKDPATHWFNASATAAFAGSFKITFAIDAMGQLAQDATCCPQRIKFAACRPYLQPLVELLLRATNALPLTCSAKWKHLDFL